MRIHRALIAGATLGGVGAVCAWPFFHATVDPTYQLMIPFSGVAALVSGGILWLLVVPAHSHVGALRPFVVGAATGFLAHPFAWYLLIIFNFLRGTPGSLGEAPLGPVDGLKGALVLSLWSWFLAGWLTIPVGGLVGLVLRRVVANAGGSRENGRA